MKGEYNVHTVVGASVDSAEPMSPGMIAPRHGPRQPRVISPGEDRPLRAFLRVLAGGLLGLAQLALAG